MRSHREEDWEKIVALMQQAELERLPDQEILQGTYELSDAFYGRMERLQKKMRRKEKRRKWCTAAAAVAVVAAATAVVVYPQGIVEAGKRIMLWKNGFAQFHFKEQAEFQGLPRYTLEYVPDGYELEMDEYYENAGILLYSNGKKDWCFSYSLSDSDISVNNENVNFSLLKLDDGKEIYYFEAMDDNVDSDMEWLSKDGNVAFSITGRLSKEEMLKILRGVSEK